MNQRTDRVRKQVKVTGIVQGVGFRPFVSRLARQFQLSGLVRNQSDGVTIEIEGGSAPLAEFIDSLRVKGPVLARIDSLVVADMPPDGGNHFQIMESVSAARESTPVSPDVATCDACLAELNDPQNRRYRYPFINCTNCGPRYTIIRDIPYDRPRTTMSGFAMCGACDEEYHDAADRRYHAQPNACTACGPTIWFVGHPAADSDAACDAPPLGGGQDPIKAFHECIRADGIVATKGIGGFHLACSAVSTAAIQKLRERKGRVSKPLAVMVADSDAARQAAYVDEDEERLLRSRSRPIVLLRLRRGNRLSELIAPGNDFIGLMLPYSPLHALLVERGPLVMTSANLSEEPIVRTNGEAFERLRGLADSFLLHNRPIHVVCDDSIARVVAGRELPLRRSRGYAPLPVPLGRPVTSVLAVGGELKSTFCLTKNDYAYMSPHIGDMGNLETLDAFRRTVEHFQQLFRIRPEIVACDMHPSWLSGQWARQFASEHQLKLIEVQHHHAHIASVLAEHGYAAGTRVIGISFDGTGYGPDRTIRGGEVLIASCREYERWAHLGDVLLPGGNSAVRHPYRAALAFLKAAGLPWDLRLPCVAHCPENERRLLHTQLERNLNCVPSSSMGRLFDAVAALVGVRQSVNYEAQAAVEMESLADSRDLTKTYPFCISSKVPHVVDVTPMLVEISQNVIAQVSQGTILGRFHGTIGQMIVRLCELARDASGLNEVVLSGGVFQNALLLRLTLEHLQARNFIVLTHRSVPPNDGGLALGQAIVAAQQNPG